jgi:hypothetical protein
MTIRQKEEHISGDPRSALSGTTGNQTVVDDQSIEGLKRNQADLMRAQLDKGKTVSVPDSYDIHPTGYDPDTGKFDERLQNRTAHAEPVQAKQSGPVFAMGAGLGRHPKAADPAIFQPRALPPRPRSR